MSRKYGGGTPGTAAFAPDHAPYVHHDDREAPARHAFASANGRIGDWMQTASRGMFWLLDPRADEIHIRDIAWHLSLICRYNGACGLDEPWHYSVAQHSVYVSYQVPREWALAGLMHDAPEAYCCDIHRPLKRSLAGYKSIEHRIWRAVAERFILPVDLPECVKQADDAVLLAEQAQIMGESPAPWSIPGIAAPVTIDEITPRQAMRRFLARFTELTGQAV